MKIAFVVHYSDGCNNYNEDKCSDYKWFLKWGYEVLMIVKVGWCGTQELLANGDD